MTLTKHDLKNKLQHKIGSNFKEASGHVEALITLIKDTLENGEDVKISGFGIFEVKDKRARRGRNPQTGDTITIEPRRVITFKSSNLLKDAINRAQQ
jgi:integration host factor subunit alpha